MLREAELIRLIKQCRRYIVSWCWDMSEHFEFGRQNKTNKTKYAVKRCRLHWPWIDRPISWWIPRESFLLGTATNPVFQDTHYCHILERHNLHPIWRSFGIIFHFFPAIVINQDTEFVNLCQSRVHNILNIFMMKYRIEYPILGRYSYRFHEIPQSGSKAATSNYPNVQQFRCLFTCRIEPRHAKSDR